MADNDALAVLQKITSEGLSLGDLINAAGGYMGAGDLGLAEQIYKIWIQFNPAHPQLCIAHFNLASLQSQIGDNASAIANLERAIALDADFQPAYVNLGGLQERAGGLEQAIATWSEGANRPMPITGGRASYAFTAMKQIARALLEAHQQSRAEAALWRCADIDPTQMDAIGQLVAVRLSQCKWPPLQPWDRVDRRTLLLGANPLSMAAYSDDPLLQLGAASRFTEREGSCKAEAIVAERRDADIDLNGRRLRVGYVSSDLRDHAVGYLMAELFELHDKARVEVFAYYCGPAANDALNARTQAAVEHYADIRGLSDDDAARLIANDRIDILIDVNGHTRDSRTPVFARRPAPILVNWLGYPGTMGSPYHHYIIGDPWIIPPQNERFYSEAVRRIPCYQPNDRRRVVSDVVPTRADAGLPDDAFVFCCFNGAQKITPFTFDRWMQILERTPGSVLWLLDTHAETNARLREHAQARGIDPDRLVFAPKQPNPFHLARYPLADLFLDTAPYGAHTTASDALWMSVPVLTLSGRSFASRVCGSLVSAAGAPELVCETAEDYVERAVALGADRAAAAALRDKLRAARDTCVLFDMDLLVRSVEDLLHEMVAEYQAGQRPTPDLTNLEAYLEVGIGLDVDEREMLTQSDFESLYKAALTRRHLTRPLRPDDRLWTDQDVAAAQGRGA
ncbi:N-acetylglucosamine transferase [Caulobacter sp.]|uniref:O-linked N-acetylglucosamine transferase, SPINDLY family protein n=1 Tax=Caulobacter sp. TaxID=78 RepID=UPI003BA8DF63